MNQRSFLVAMWVALAAAGCGAATDPSCPGGGSACGTGGDGSGAGGDGSGAGGNVAGAGGAGAGGNVAGAGGAGAGGNVAGAGGAGAGGNVAGAGGAGAGAGGDAGAAGTGGSAGGSVDGGARTCGGLAGLRCSQGESCVFEPEQCRNPDVSGTCVKTGGVGCTAQYDPVCGCDGTTYGNACEALARGASVLHRGACDTGGKLCGGIAGFPCPAGQYCEFAAGQCQMPDAAGTCRPFGQICTADVNPVCGCDGKTYSNSCQATVAGMSVLYVGPCAQSCTVGTAQYPNGTDGIMAPDGCNICSCSNGQLACTKRACNVTSCIVDSKVYVDGATGVPDPNSCNVCSCLSGTLAQCSQYPCSLTKPGCRVGRALYHDGSESVTADGSVKCVCNSGTFECAAIH